MLAGSTINTQKRDFRNPFMFQQSTFGSSKFGKINKKAFMREYKHEFLGLDSPPPTLYTPGLTEFKEQKYSSKTLTRDQRICPIVSKMQHSIPAVSPQAYLDMHHNSSFTQEKKNSPHYGSRAVRNIDPKQYSQLNHISVQKGQMF